jgi:hypothetical protein
MMPTPRWGSTLVVPTQAPKVDWPSTARKVMGPIGVSDLEPFEGGNELGRVRASRLADAVGDGPWYVMYPMREPSTGGLSPRFV